MLLNMSIAFKVDISITLIYLDWFINIYKVQTAGGQLVSVKNQWQICFWHDSTDEYAANLNVLQEVCRTAKWTYGY